MFMRIPTDCNIALSRAIQFNSIQFNWFIQQHIQYSLSQAEFTIVCALERDTLEVVKLVWVCVPIAIAL